MANASSLQKIEEIKNDIFLLESKNRSILKKSQEGKDLLKGIYRAEEKLKGKINQFKNDETKKDFILSKLRRNISTSLLKLSLLQNNQEISQQIISRRIRENIKKNIDEINNAENQRKLIFDKLTSFRNRLESVKNNKQAKEKELSSLIKLIESNHEYLEKLSTLKVLEEEEYLTHSKDSIPAKVIDTARISQWSVPMKNYKDVQRKDDGLEFKFNYPQNINSISNGEVVYSDVLANFGRILIIKHENDIRSLFLGDFHTELSKGLKVLKGEKLGQVLEGIDQKIYFEMRKNEKNIKIDKYYSFNDLQSEKI